MNFPYKNNLKVKQTSKNFLIFSILNKFIIFDSINFLCIMNNFFKGKSKSYKIFKKNFFFFFFLHYMR
jgi:hypothetical protein